MEQNVRFAFLVELEELLERRVDVLTLEDAGADPVLLAEAVAEGRTIVDREGPLGPARLRSQGDRCRRSAASSGS